MLDKWTGTVVGYLHVYEISYKALAKKLGWHEKYLSAVLHCKRRPKNAEAKVMKALSELINEAVVLDIQNNQNIQSNSNIASPYVISVERGHEIAEMFRAL